MHTLQRGSSVHHILELNIWSQRAKNPSRHLQDCLLDGSYKQDTSMLQEGMQNCNTQEHYALVKKLGYHKKKFSTTLVWVISYEYITRAQIAGSILFAWQHILPGSIFRTTQNEYKVSPIHEAKHITIYGKSQWGHFPWPRASHQASDHHGTTEQSFSLVHLGMMTANLHMQKIWRVSLLIEDEMQITTKVAH